MHPAARIWTCIWIALNRACGPAADLRLGYMRVPRCTRILCVPPQAIMLEVDTQPTASTSGYSLEAWLISDGIVVPLGSNFDYSIKTNNAGQQWGVFGYSGLMAGFPD